MEDSRIGYVISSLRSDDLAAAAAASIRALRPDSRIAHVRADAIRRGKTLLRPQLGYAESLNCGARLVPREAEFLCYLNADVEMLEDDSPALALFEDERVALVGPRQVNAADEIVHGGIVPEEDGSEWDLGLRHRCWRWPLAGPRTEELTSGTFDVPMVAGSVVYARRKAIEAIGGWPEFSPFYFEDTTLCYHLRHLGWRVLYTGSVTWRHLHEQGSPFRVAERSRRFQTAQRAFIEECERLGIPLRLGAEG